MAQVHRTCDFDDCTSKHWSSGYCEKHYRRWKRHGDPAIVLRQTGLPVEVRFWMKVQRGKPDECWFWISRQISSDGYYGMFSTPDREVMAHRFAYEITVGLIPEGLTVDHLCRNTFCMNSAHMELVTNSENVRREWQWRKLQQKA